MSRIAFLLLLLLASWTPALAQEHAGTEPPKRLGANNPRQFGFLFLGVSRTRIQEGENLDLVLTLSNDLSHPVPGLVPPDQKLGSLAIRVERLDSKRGKTFAQDGAAFAKRVREAAVHGRPYEGVRFSLPANRAREFRVLLFGGAPGGPGWLQPGTYLLQAAYVSRPSEREAFAGQEEIFWDSPLLSGGIRLTVTPPAKARAKGVAAARRFLASEPSAGEHEAFLGRARKLLTLDPGPSLARRIQWHAATRLLAKGGERIRSVRQLEALSRQKLTPAERDLVHTTLGDLYLADDQLAKARAVLTGIATPRAEFLLESLE